MERGFIQRAQAVVEQIARYGRYGNTFFETDECEVRGAVAMTAVFGKRVRLQWGNMLNAIGIWRDGKKRDWSIDENKALFHSGDGDLIHCPGRATARSASRRAGRRLSRM